MKQVLDETRQIHYVDECDIINFIVVNSNIQWDDCCDFVIEHNITSDDGKRLWNKESLLKEENIKHYDKEAYYWVLEFFNSHPWIKEMMIVFDS